MPCLGVPARNRRGHCRGPHRSCRTRKMRLSGHRRGLAAEVPAVAKVRANCWLAPAEMPPDWLRALSLGRGNHPQDCRASRRYALNPDKRLLRRRECEFEIFRSVEEAVELPVIKAGFSSIEEFMARAQTILQRRKSRSGRSLELHARALFVEEGLKEGTHFVHQPPESDPGKRGPDFLFPSPAAYADPHFPTRGCACLR